MVFNDRKFIVVHKGEIGDAELNELTELIKNNGGSIVSWGERLSTDVANKLVIVATTTGFERYGEMRRLKVPTVSPSWIHECVNMGKLVPTQPYSPDPRDYLKDVCIVCSSSMTPGDTQAILAGVKSAGGEYSAQLSRYTSHLITTDPDVPECQLARDSGVDIKIVSPLWFDDCIKLGRNIPAEPYQFENDGADPMAAETPDFTGKYSQSLKDARRAVQSSVRTALGSSIFEGRSFFFGSDLGVSPPMARTLQFLVGISSGTVVESLSDATVYLGRWRESSEYVEASKCGLIVGSILWLFDMVNSHRWESPLHHLLHYPEVQGGMPEMQGLSICATNYTGTSRNYVQSLIQSLGATYSPNLKASDTTHLIAAYPKGNKYASAREWGINVVNHLWLEETYAKWQRQDETNPRFTHFSPRINLAMVVDSTHLIPSVLKQFWDPEHAVKAVRRPPRETRKAGHAANEWLQDAMDRETEFLEEQRAPKRLRKAEADDHSSIVESPENLDRSKQASETPDDEPNVAARLEPIVNEKIEKETEERSSSATKNRGDKENLRPSKPSKKTKTSISPAPMPSSGSSSSPAPAASERAKRIRVLFTGIDSPPSVKECTKLGLHKVENPPAQIVVAPRFLRTAKFLRSLASADSFVGPEWIDACKKAGNAVPVEDYHLMDPELVNAVKNRAKLGEDSLFTGMVFFVAPILKAKIDIVRQLLKAHDGEVSRVETPETITIGGPTLPFESFLDSIANMDASDLRSRLADQANA